MNKQQPEIDFSPPENDNQVPVGRTEKMLDFVHKHRKLVWLCVFGVLIGNENYWSDQVERTRNAAYSVGYARGCAESQNRFDDIKKREKLRNSTDYDEWFLATQKERRATNCEEYDYSGCSYPLDGERWKDDLCFVPKDDPSGYYTENAFRSLLAVADPTSNPFPVYYCKPWEMPVLTRLTVDMAVRRFIGQHPELALDYGHEDTPERDLERLVWRFETPESEKGRLVLIVLGSPINAHY